MFPFVIIPTTGRGTFLRELESTRKSFNAQTIQSCSSGPGFSCEEGTFYEYAKDRLRGVSFYEDCDVSKVSKEKELTFYWDWNTTRYNASLVNQ
ncbi:CIC_collapsed_G0008540.mRNA.1.CDS.1 [Saccharomyces cerevisiae]|nr:CIC_collapsed_G0008540.mRNA.1.CDS.1 [Saccharomyces cerevisiae]